MALTQQLPAAKNCAAYFEKEPMAITPELIREIGRLLHGEEFVAQLGRELGMNQRNFERMLAGTRPIPDGVARELLALIDVRRNQIAQKLGLADDPQHR